MGDILHSLPAVAALRQSFPSAVIGWVVEERWAALLSTAAAQVGPRGVEKPLVDHIHLVNTKAWRDAPLSGKTWKAVRGTIGELRAMRYDTSVDIQGAMKSAVLGRFAGARNRYGFAQPRESMATMFYGYPIPASGTHIVDQNLSLAMAVGAADRGGKPFPLPIDPVAEAWADRELQRRGLPAFAILNPGAGWGSKCWPAQSFGEVARRLTASGIGSLINFGPGEESLVNAVEEASQSAAQRISCSLSELIALTRRATLFIGGDTGPLHLAAALKTPCIALFGPTDPARNGPFSEQAIVLRSPQSLTTYKRSTQADEGLASISVDEVIAAASKLLGRDLG
jgi:heptosyltransferase-1